MMHYAQPSQIAMMPACPATASPCRPCYQEGARRKVVMQVRSAAPSAPLLQKRSFIQMRPVQVRSVVRACSVDQTYAMHGRPGARASPVQVRAIVRTKSVDHTAALHARAVARSASGTFSEKTISKYTWE